MTYILCVTDQRTDRFGDFVSDGQVLVGQDKHTLWHRNPLGWKEALVFERHVPSPAREVEGRASVSAANARDPAKPFSGCFAGYRHGCPSVEAQKAAAETGQTLLRDAAYRVRRSLERRDG